MQSFETNQTEKPKAKAIERITIENSLREKLMKLTDQANAALNPMAAVTKSDVINFILKSRPETLSPIELEELKTEHIDEVKLSQWITAKLKEAHASGEPVTLRELIEQNSDLFNCNQLKRRKMRKPKKARGKEPTTETENTGDMTAVGNQS